MIECKNIMKVQLEFKDYWQLFMALEGKNYLPQKKVQSFCSLLLSFIKDTGNVELMICFWSYQSNFYAFHCFDLFLCVLEEWPSFQRFSKQMLDVYYYF